MAKSDAEKWKAVVEVFATRGGALGACVDLAIEDPARYVVEHRRELRERGIAKPFPHLPLIALLDGLDAAKRVALLDWKASLEDVESGLEALRPRPSLDWSWTKAIAEDDADDLSTERILKAVAVHAAPRVLVNLDTASDQFAVIVVQPTDARRIVLALKSVGHRAVTIAPKPLGRSAPKKNGDAAAVRATPLAAWPDCSNDPAGTWRYFIHRTTVRSICTVRYETAFDVMEGPAWSTNTKKEKRTFRTPAICAASYATFYEELKRLGFEQLDADEHARALTANAAARKGK